MNKITGNEPANPTKVGDSNEPGLTTRQYFACRAAQGIAANPVYDGWTEQMIAKGAVSIADALIDELNKEK